MREIFCVRDASVRAMFSDQRDISVDSEILEEMDLDALNADTIKGYRVLFEQLLKDIHGINY